MASGASSGASASGRLTARERLGYGLGDLGINFYFLSSLTYLLFFYTDVFGIGPAAAASVLFAARLVDAVTDPLMGAIADRTRSRWGRLRPYLLFGALPLAAIAVAMFSTPDLGPSGLLLWAYVTYIGFGIAYTVVAIPYSALTASLTHDAGERTTVTSVRMFCAFAGGFLVSVATLPLVSRFSDPAAGFQATMILYAIAATALLWICFAATEERVAPIRPARVPLRASFAALSRNGPLWLVIAVFSLGMLSFTFRQTAVPYYFKYNLAREDLIAWYFALTMPAMMAGLLVVPWLGRRFGKAGGLIWGAGVGIAASIGLYLTPFDRIGWVFFFSILASLGGAPTAALGWAMIPDTVEYAQWKTGVRAEATIYATASFVQKLAKAVAGSGAALTLAAFGFVPNAVQSPAALEAILALMSLIPAAGLLLLILVAASYRLDAEAHARIVRELELAGGG